MREIELSGIGSRRRERWMDSNREVDDETNLRQADTDENDDKELRTQKSTQSNPWDSEKTDCERTRLLVETDTQNYTDEGQRE